jgi:hypothetical protein
MSAVDFKPGLPSRLRAFSTDAVLDGEYPVTFALSVGGDGALVEVAIRPTGTIGRSGHGLELIFEDLGIALSRAIQGRNPQNGQPVPYGLFMDAFMAPLAGTPVRLAIERDEYRVTAIRIDVSDPKMAGLARMMADLGPALTMAIDIVWHDHDALRMSGLPLEATIARAERTARAAAARPTS